MITPRSVRRSILIAFAMVGMLTIAATTWFVFASGRANDLLADELLDEATDLVLVQRLRFAAYDRAVSQRAYLQTADRSYAERASEARAEVEALHVRLRPSLETPTGQQLFVQLEALERVHQKAYAEAQRLLAAGATRATLTTFYEAQMRPVLRSLREAAERFSGYKERKLERLFRASIGESRTAIGVALLVTAVALALLLFLANQVSHRMAEAFAREQEALAQARQAVASRDDILHVVSHDLRGSLTVLAGYADLLGNKLRKDAAAFEQYGDYLGRLRAGIRRTNNLVESLVDPASVESGLFTVRPGRSTIGELLDLVRSVLEPEVERRGFHLGVRCDERGSAIRADSPRLLQVVSNLVDNSMKFSVRGGTIRIEATTGPSEVTIAVTDEGTGIAPEQLERVFERHWRAPGQDHPGLGLGLFICKSIVDAHGGRIWAENDTEGGARFCFTLPRLEDGAPAQDDPTPLRH